jgi:hypothetical protein
MYHPADTGYPDDPNTEYIELTNIGTETINLKLVQFTDGIDFTFPSFELDPGKCCLVVKNTVAFEARYGPDLPVAGQYAGSLANDGERIELVDAIGETIQNFKYEDNWYDTTDGYGHSLINMNPALAGSEELSQKDAWNASAYTGGSPGEL